MEQLESDQEEAGHTNEILKGRMTDEQGFKANRG